MCLGIPARVVAVADGDARVADVETGSTRRRVSLDMLPAGGKRVEAGNWVVVHMGFAMDAIGADEAMDILRSMAELGMAEGVGIPETAAE